MREFIRLFVCVFCGKVRSHMTLIKRIYDMYGQHFSNNLSWEKHDIFVWFFKTVGTGR